MEGGKSQCKKIIKGNLGHWVCFKPKRFTWLSCQFMTAYTFCCQCFRRVLLSRHPIHKLILWVRYAEENHWASARMAWNSKMAPCLGIVKYHTFFIHADIWPQLDLWTWALHEGSNSPCSMAFLECEIPDLRKNLSREPCDNEQASWENKLKGTRMLTWLPQKSKSWESFSLHCTDQSHWLKRKEEGDTDISSQGQECPRIWSHALKLPSTDDNKEKPQCFTVVMVNTFEPYL